MTIAPFITKDYLTVSLHEEMTKVADTLTSGSFLIVINEEHLPVGLINHFDFLMNPKGLVKDSNYIKPVLSLNHRVTDAFKLMTKSGSYALPVFHNEEFLGVINQADLSLQLINQYKGYKHLFKNVVKNLRSPIANMLGLTTFLESDIHVSEKKEMIAIANKTCKQAIGILNELEFIEKKGISTLSFQRTELNSFIRNCISTIPVYTKNIKLNFEAADEDFYYSIDRMHFRAAIQNLVANAIKFSPSNKSIFISLRLESGKAIGQVRDEGPGMTEDDKKKHEDFISRMVEKGYTRKQVRLLCEWYLRVRKSQ